jgi:hypothetical protein
MSRNNRTAIYTFNSPAKKIYILKTYYPSPKEMLVTAICALGMLEKGSRNNIEDLTTAFIAAIRNDISTIYRKTHKYHDGGCRVLTGRDDLGYYKNSPVFEYEFYRSNTTLRVRIFEILYDKNEVSQVQIYDGTFANFEENGETILDNLNVIFEE